MDSMREMLIKHINNLEEPEVQLLWRETFPKQRESNLGHAIGNTVRNKPGWGTPVFGDIKILLSPQNKRKSKRCDPFIIYRGTTKPDLLASVSDHNLERGWMKANLIAHILHTHKQPASLER